MKIKDIGSTIERLENREAAAAFGFDVSFVLYANVKKDNWKTFHKIVVKIPYKRNELLSLNKKLLTDTAIRKMQDVLKVTIDEPES